MGLRRLNEDHHQTAVIEGAPIDAAWMRETAGAILAERQAEADRIAAEAHAEAAARREAKIAAGFDPDDCLIEKLRVHFDLSGLLLATATTSQAPSIADVNSEFGSYGAESNLSPALIAFLPQRHGPAARQPICRLVRRHHRAGRGGRYDILDFGGNRKKALAELAKRFGLTNAEEQRKVAALIFRLRRDGATQAEIETAARAKAAPRLARAEIIRVATGCSQLHNAVQIREAA